MDKEKDLKSKYVRSVIKLGNSRAITFPQEWTTIANLEEKSEVNLYPIDEKSIIIRAKDDAEVKTVLKVDSTKWPIKLMRQALISAFKLNVDEIYIKYPKEDEEKLYELLIESRKEIIGLDFKTQNNQFYVNFLLDTKKTDFSEVLMDLASVFQTIISNVINGKGNKHNELLLAEIDRKYSLGTRILITGLSEFPFSRGHHNFPLIRFLGNRVILLYIRDFINESLNFQKLPFEIIKKYSSLLSRIPNMLIDIIKNYDQITLESISEFQDYLKTLHERFTAISFNENEGNELQIRTMISYFLNIFHNFFDIGITRLIESEIGMA